MLMIKDYKDYVEFFAAAVAIITGIATAFIFIRKWFISYNEKLNKFFTRTWGNEGSVGGPIPTHYVELVLECKDHEVSGYFNTRNLSSGSTWNNVGITGRRNGSTLKCSILHVRNGEVLNYGTVVLKKHKKLLKWTLKNGVADFFPEEAELFAREPV